MNMIFLIDNEQRRYCNDGHLRSHAMWGTLGSCVKTYKTVQGAARAAKNHKLDVVCIPEGMKVDASGVVIETIPDEPGFVTYKNHKLTDFLVDIL